MQKKIVFSSFFLTRLLIVAYFFSLLGFFCVTKGMLSALSSPNQTLFRFNYLEVGSSFYEDKQCKF
jgi:hypothetical protein